MKIKKKNHRSEKRNGEPLPPLKNTPPIKCPLINGEGKHRRERMWWEEEEGEGEQKGGEEWRESETICFCHFLARSTR